MPVLNLPSEVEAVFREFRTGELTTIAKDGTPVTWPLVVMYHPEEGRFIAATSIGLANKVYHVRRNPHVSVLFSEPKASGLTNPPAVLVQGDAEAPDEITSAKGLEDYWRTIFQRQPSSKDMSRTALNRYLVDWYYMRIRILIKPRRISWWPAGDFSQPAQQIEVNHVG